MKEQLTPYYLAATFNEEIYTAGIVRFHQEKMMDAAGFKSIRFKYPNKKGIFTKYQRLVQCIKLAFTVPANSIVFFHFPIQATIDELLLLGLYWRGIKTVALIIDIDGLRDQNDQLLKRELNQLNKFSYSVAHNNEMKNWLKQHLSAAKIFTITVFDYTYTGMAVKKQFTPIVCFAGNISKASFVYKLYKIESLVLNVYGLGYQSSLDVNGGFSYKGIAPPDQLPFVVNGSFGLVWDGDKLDDCDPYLQYNNPHKLSLYLAAGMPVIVWDKSAVATWVVENNIGFCIHSIAEISNCIKNISINSYEVMQKNAALIGSKICNGHYFKTVLTEILQL